MSLSPQQTFRPVPTFLRVSRLIFLPTPSNGVSKRWWTTEITQAEGKYLSLLGVRHSGERCGKGFSGVKRLVSSSEGDGRWTLNRRMMTIERKLHVRLKESYNLAQCAYCARVVTKLKRTVDIYQ